MGIKGKEDADRLAKQAVEEEMVGIEIHDRNQVNDNEKKHTNVAKVLE